MVDEEMARWLASAEGCATLASLPPYRSSDVFTTTTSLRALGYTPHQCAALLTQSRLRAQAGAKFGEDLASSWLFTDAGYQQATRRVVADYHARRFLEAGAKSVIDAGCALGADTAAFARAGLRALGVDIDEATAILADHNMRYANNSHTTVEHYIEPRIVCGNLTALLPTLRENGEYDAVWLDPARRDNHGKRIYDPEKWQPALSTAVDLARSFRYAGIKLGPGIALENLPEDAHVEWMSCDGEVVEAVAWFGVDKPGRSALLVRGDAPTIHDGDVPVSQPSGTDINTNEPRQLPCHTGSQTTTHTGSWASSHTDSRIIASQPTADNTDSSMLHNPILRMICHAGVPNVPVQPTLEAECVAPGMFLYEPDGAAIRAGGIPVLCEEYGLSPVSEGIAYLCGTRKVTSPWLRGFVIEDILPLKAKPVGAYMKERGITRVEVKKRGTDVDPATFRKKLSLRPSSSGTTITETTLILTRIAGKHVCIVTQPADA
ncbi:class I SAM-dependent methyltransferase [Actinotignum urinale]|uniref:class I SAM-dependent methyltransferase n=1 Tax=Actinotignum urinale TaxID=190146 RepID=UPI0004277D26|nr:hypothetical protein [Actinotignum urinale]MDY5159873.1 hypothetical protein [Actinotignum urinale]